MGMGIIKCKFTLNIISLREFGLYKFNLGSYPLRTLRLVHLEKCPNIFDGVKMGQKNIRERLSFSCTNFHLKRFSKSVIKIIWKWISKTATQISVL